MYRTHKIYPLHTLSDNILMYYDINYPYLLDNGF